MAGRFKDLRPAPENGPDEPEPLPAPSPGASGGVARPSGGSVSSSASPSGFAASGQRRGRRERLARKQALRQAVSDWAARNNFQCQHQLTDELPLRISGREDELELVLECRTPRQGNEHRQPEMVWTCRARAAESLELIVLDRKVYDFSQSKLGQMVTSMAAGAAAGWPGPAPSNAGWSALRP